MRCRACDKRMSEIDLSNDFELCLICLGISEETLNEELETNSDFDDESEE